jgi:RNA polymerase sigma factor (sigma-70 family)
MEKYPFVYKELHPHLEAVFNGFIQQYHHELSNQVIENFLSVTEYYQLFVDAVCFPTPRHRKQLDEAFRKFYAEIRLIHYISKLISRVSRDCYQKEKKQNRKRLILHNLNRDDQAVKEGWEQRLPGKEEEAIDIIVRNTKSLLDSVSDPFLYQALQQLTKRQLDILELYFLYNFTHAEIGQVLGISQQSVSKSYNRALHTLREIYKEGECIGTQ